MESMKKQLENILHRAGEMVREGHYATVSAKEGHANYVTNCDVAVQEYLMDALHALLPSARFIAEESDGITLTEEDTFCVDPIDGTLNFIHGRRASAISVALLSRRDPCWAPCTIRLRTRFFSRGRGRARLSTASLCAFHTSRLKAPSSPSAHRLITPSFPAKRCGFSPALCRRRRTCAAWGPRRWTCATWRAAAATCYFELELSPWDHAGGWAHRREAAACL